MELQRLHFGREQNLSAIVAIRIYYFVLHSEERRSLRVRDDMVGCCALRFAYEIAEDRGLGNIFPNVRAKEKFLGSVRRVMDNIRRKDRLQHLLKERGYHGFLPADEEANGSPTENSSVPQQTHFSF